MKFDSGYTFGIGAFETISIYKGKPVLFDMHLERLNGTLNFLGINKYIEARDVLEFCFAGGEKEDFSLREYCRKPHSFFRDKGVLKLMVSQENNIFSVRENPYDISDMNSAVSLGVPDVIRNETSPFVNHKTFNYGENLFLKKDAVENGLHDYLFLNSKGNVAETSTGNIFFVREGKLFTPGAEDGILPGVMRRFVLERSEDIVETEIAFSELDSFEECFVTNSLTGILPVIRVEGFSFEVGKKTAELKKLYLNYLEEFDGKNIL